MIQPYFADDRVELYHGDMREILPALEVRVDAVVTDPPYGETALAWDRWPDGWVQALDDVTDVLWCFGSMRMFLERRDDFAGWKLAQDYVGEFEVDTMVWEKTAGSGPVIDRFNRIHELAVQWYRGLWRDIYHDVPRVPAEAARVNKIGSVYHRKPNTVPHRGGYAAVTAYVDDHTRKARSVVKAKNMRRRGIHPTEKPSEILDPLIQYSVPVGGLVLDPFAGSGSTLSTARSLGRRAVGIEADERYCDLAARRLASSADD